MPALGKRELAERLAAEINVTKKAAKQIVDAFFAEIILALTRGESVKLSGFGNFQLRDKGSRPGRNPKTLEEVAIAPRRVVTFRAGQKLRARVEQCG
jgi:integration host factor subunit alpha